MSEKEANAVRKQDVLSFREMRYLACPGELVTRVWCHGRVAIHNLSIVWFGDIARPDKR